MLLVFYIVTPENPCKKPSAFPLFIEFCRHPHSYVFLFPIHIYIYIYSAIVYFGTGQNRAHDLCDLNNET